MVTYQINETSIFIIYSRNIIEAVINVPTKKDRTDFATEFYQTSKEKVTSIQLKLFHRKAKT